MSSKFKVGDRVEVLDPGLAMLRQFSPKGAKPNNIGKVSKIMDKGDILVEFKLSGKNHSQVAPYPENMVRLIQ